MNGSSSRHVLIVEDDAVLRNFMQEVIQRKGLRVFTARNGIEAVSFLEKEAVQLVITDLRMDGMDGMELLRTVKEKTPSTEVIITTAFGSVTSAVEAMKQGAFDFITKPLDLEKLDVLIDRVMAHRTLVDENQFLKEQLQGEKIVRNIIGHSAASKRVRELIQTVGPLDSTVLIQGETGTGKEVAANAIQAVSSRRNRPFIKVNCAALPDTLLESELFGHEKGAFTGAHQMKKGRFELADGGTLLMDEIGELGLPVQAKLLRALQYQQFERVGGGETLQVDVRLIAITNRDLKEEVKEGRFRKDLYFRLNVVTIPVLPLRDRMEDLPLFVDTFLKIYNQKYSKDRRLSDKAMERLMNYNWLGNIRELENCIETSVILAGDDVLKPEHFMCLEEHQDLFADCQKRGDALITLEEAERHAVLSAYSRLNQNKTHTARALGITIKTLRSKLRNYGMIEEANG